MKLKNKFFFVQFQIIDDYYHFHHNSVSKRSISPSHRHQGRLDEDHRVRWAKQQRAKSRRKRDFLRLRQPQSSLSNYMPWNDPKWSHMWYLVSFFFLLIFLVRKLFQKLSFKHTVTLSHNSLRFTVE